MRRPARPPARNLQMISSTLGQLILRAVPDPDRLFRCPTISPATAVKIIRAVSGPIQGI
jgi:hypothetical protein